jgi:hypothetical protein
LVRDWCSRIACAVSASELSGRKYNNDSATARIASTASVGCETSIVSLKVNKGSVIKFQEPSTFSIKLNR